jgi:hypothetical protein
MANYTTKVYPRMTSLLSLKDKINRLAYSVINDQFNSGSPGSTIGRLCAVATSDFFNEHNNKEIDFFSKKYDTAQKLFSSYDNKGLKSSDVLLCREGLQIFAGLLYLRVVLSADRGISQIDRAKYINVCWKAFEHIQLPEFLSYENENLTRLQDELFKQFPVKSLQAKALLPHKVSNVRHVNYKDFRILPIDILFYEGPIARAYLEILYSLGCKPRRIINLIAERDIVTKKPVGKFLPSSLRNKYASAVQAQKIHHWPKYLFRKNKKLCLEIFECLHETLNVDQSALLAIFRLKPLEHYSDNIINLPIASLKDPKLFDFLTEQNISTFLFTGGGILPKAFFNLKNTRFIHVHPGYLPDIRGADCLLWSAMLAGQPSATCFFMDTGIDTGEIINTAFLPRIKLPVAARDLNEKLSYRLLYSFIDPWVRSAVLRDTLRSTDYLENITSTPQPLKIGTTFHFMHSNMSSKIIKEFII